MRALAVLLVLAACAPAPTPSAQPSAPPPAEEARDDASDVAVTQAAAPVGADPSLNESWMSEDVDPLVGRLESEDREVYVNRNRLVEVVGLKPGLVVADVGSGSGFMAILFAQAVGKTGRVVALDINPVLLERLDEMAKKEGLTNVETRLSAQDRAPLEPASVDLIWICDTYHHFESPGSTLASLHAALRPGGELVVVDFERIEGVTNERMMQHVRAGKEVFRQEIVDAGFELVREEDVPELEENYVLRFRKP